MIKIQLEDNGKTIIDSIKNELIDEIFIDFVQMLKILGYTKADIAYGISALNEANKEVKHSTHPEKVQTYRTKIQAIQLTENNWDEVEEFCEGDAYNFDETGYTITTLEGFVPISCGDFIIKDAKGDIYPCKPDIFKKTYEYVENSKIQLN